MLFAFGQLSDDICTYFLDKGEGAERVEKMLGWVPPPWGTYKLNIDCCLKENPGDAGSAGVFRCGDRSWVVGFSRHIGLTSNNVDGLIIAREQNCFPFKLKLIHKWS